MTMSGGSHGHAYQSDNHVATWMTKAQFRKHDEALTFSLWDERFARGSFARRFQRRLITMKHEDEMPQLTQLLSIMNLLFTSGSHNDTSLGHVLVCTWPRMLMGKGTRSEFGFHVSKNHQQKKTKLTFLIHSEGKSLFRWLLYSCTIQYMRGPGVELTIVDKTASEPRSEFQQTLWRGWGDRRSHYYGMDQWRA